jgi:hypothetical protein
VNFLLGNARSVAGTAERSVFTATAFSPSGFDPTRAWSRRVPIAAGTVDCSFCVNSLRETFSHFPGQSPSFRNLSTPHFAIFRNMLPIF